MRTQRGFTLIELLVAMLLMVVVSGALYRLLTGTQRLSRSQFEHADMQANMRAGALVVPAELRELGYDTSTTLGGAANSDIIAMAADSVVIRAIRASGVICQLASNTITVDTSRNYSALRLPVGGTDKDSLMIFNESDPTIRTDDQWVRRRLEANPTAGTCPAAAPWNSHAGLNLSVQNIPWASGGAWPGDSFTVGSAIRVFDPVVYKFYTNSGRTWLGSYSKEASAGSIQPILGPLASTSGFAYLDSAGTVTTTRSAVRTMRITIVAQSDRPISSGPSGDLAVQNDSMVTLVALRNTLR
jgi:prepilin-type N-terminal cleavage/methylation domain-containing protein